MTSQEQTRGAETAKLLRAFLASHDRGDADARATVFRIRERVHSEQYRRERESYAAWIDFGGEGG